MSLTPEEIAMCRDALFDAGVPVQIVGEFMALGDRVRVVRCERQFSMPELLLIEQKTDVNRYMKDKMHIDLSKKLIEDAVCRVIENPNHEILDVRLELNVLTPPGWKPPDKVTR